VLSTHPVVMPVFPITGFFPFGKQIGLILLLNDTGVFNLIKPMS